MYLSTYSFLKEDSPGRSRLFMAGDNVSSAGSSMYVPREFTALGLPSLLQARCRDIADRYHADLVRDVATEGWPPPKDGGRAAVTGTHKCRGGCGASYSKIWVDNEVCFFCEARLRDEGLCASTRCTRRCFCPHHKRCFVCDGGNGWGGCTTCRLLCGDGDDVVALVQRVGAHVVFLDFDRTLATTKRGGSPLANPSSSKTATKGSLPSRQCSHAGGGEGGGMEVTDIGEDKDFGCREAGDKERLVAAAASTHTVDEALHALACSHSNVHIVTRNSNVRDIQVFLRVQGVAATVHSVPKSSGRTKADVMLALLPEETVGVFVDDSIAEHLDPRLEQCQRLHRVLFVRG